MRLSETDEIAAELYLVPPARFVAARDQVARQARAAGHRDLARELQALRRPTLSAWLINAMTRHERARMQQLFALGRELRQAQTQLDSEQLRRLPAQREDLIGELLDWARRHAAEAGVRPTEAALSEVEDTLHAGLVDLAAAAAVMSGHLVRPMSHSGFGPLPQVESAGGASASSSPTPGPAPAEPAEWRMWPVDEQRQPRIDEEVREPRVDEEVRGLRVDEEVRGLRVDDELRRRRERVEAADRTGGPASPAVRRRPPQLPGAPSRAEPNESLRRAEAELASAASVHWQREHDLAEAEAAMEAVADRQEWLEQQRMNLRREKVAAEQDLAAAREAQRAALRAMIDARRALEAAEEQLRSPSDDPR